jgi:hypothetical protein
LYSPGVKRGLSYKFRIPWSGPWLFTAQNSRLKYVSENEHGREVIVHVNGMKEPTAQQLGDEKQPRREKCHRNARNVESGRRKMSWRSPLRALFQYASLRLKTSKLSSVVQLERPEIIRTLLL